MGNRRRSLLFGGTKLPDSWHLANDAPVGSAYLALWYKNKIIGVELNGYWDAADRNLTDNIMGILVVVNQSSAIRRFIVDGEQFATALAWTNSNGAGLVEGITTSAQSAVADYEADNNTFAIFSQKGADAPATIHCIGRRFLNGSPCILPSGGYMAAINSFRTQITNIITKWGLAQLTVSSSTYYWVSTQVNATNAWRARLSGTTFSGAAKTGTNLIRRIMELPEDSGKFIPLNIDYNNDWSVVNGYRKSHLTTSANQSEEEKILLRNNFLYRKIRIYAYCETPNAPYNSYLDIGILNREWASTGVWSKRLYGYEYSAENPYIADFLVPAHGDNFLDIHMFSSQPGDRGYYKVVDVDTIPKEAQYTFSGDGFIESDYAGFNILYNFYASSSPLTGRVIINAPRKMAIRLNFFYTANKVTTLPVCYIGKPNVAVTKGSYYLKFSMPAVPPSICDYIDLIVDEGENFVDFMLDQTFNSNTYVFIKPEELLHEPTNMITIWSEWKKDIYGYYYSTDPAAAGYNVGTAARITTTENNVKVKISYFTESHSSNYFYIGKLDTNLSTSVYQARLSGSNYTAENPLTVTITIPEKGSHFIDFMYAKLSSTSVGRNAGFFKIEIIE